MKNNTPLVSIIIPVYNREKYINEAILSAVNQTYQNIEIIIGDNKSTDNTWNLIKDWSYKDERIKVFQNEKNIGPVLNWYECFKRANGEYIKILWSDDWMDKDFITKSLSIFDKETAFILSNHFIINEEDKKILFKSNYNKKEYTSFFYLCNTFYYNYIQFPVSPGCALFRKKDILESFILEIPNDDNLDSKKNGAGNDLLLYLITASKYKYIRISDTNSYFRAHNDSFSVASPIHIYYEWAKLYYVKYISKTSFYQSIMKLKYHREKQNGYAISDKIYKKLKFSFFDIFNILIMKFINKLK